MIFTTKWKIYFYNSGSVLVSDISLQNCSPDIMVYLCKYRPQYRMRFLYD